MRRILTFLVCVYLFTGSVFAQYSFEHLSVNNGLSQSTVLAIHQDSRGYMWFGTRDRLNRYDGRNIKVYKSDASDKSTISTDNYIYAITEDRFGRLWIGTQNGVNCYSPRTDSFERVTHSPSDQKSLSSNAVLSIHVAESGRVWLGTNGGLSMLKNAESRVFTNYYDKDGLGDNMVYAIFEDSKKNVWVGTTNGLTKMSPASNGKYRFSTYRNMSSANNSISSNSIKSIAEDKKGRIWIGTEKNGLNLYLPQSDSFRRFTSRSSSGISNDFIRKITVARDGKLLIATMVGLNIFNPETLENEVIRHDAENLRSLSNNSVKDVYEDKQGSIWVGTMFGGVNVLHKNAGLFTVYKYSKYRNSISSNIISVVSADEKGNLWIGTEGQGLNYLDLKTGQFKNYVHDPSKPGNIGSNTIKAIFRDSKNQIWIGLFEGGLELFRPSDGTFKHFKPDPSNANSLSNGYVSSITEDRKGRLWIGTSNSGLDLYDPGTGLFTHYTQESSRYNIGSNYIRVLQTDSKGRVWVGTVDGVYMLPPNDERFLQFKKGTKGFRSSYINCMKEGRNGDIWIGTHAGGLIRYEPEKKRFSNYSVADGLVSDNVVGIEDDEEGNLWISSSGKGLSKFNVKKGTFRSFNESDGLPGNEFSSNASFRDRDGVIYFGSYDGLVSFVPQRLRRNTVIPKVLISGLKLFNMPVEVNGPDSLLKEDISSTDKIVFQASQNVFTIDFVSLNLIHPEKNQYAYQLKGFEKHWNYVATPSATYTNLAPGRYTFLARGTNNDGVWNPRPTALTIQILPPWWRTWWAYMIYFILSGLIWYLINRFLRRQQRLETELYYEHLNNERQEELYQLKLDFFTRISHEIRTPLTLIFAPLEKLIEVTRENSSLNYQLQSIKHNTDRLLRLISELLDFRKIESGKLKLHVGLTDMVSFCENVCRAFRSEASLKEIDFGFEYEEDPVMAYIDKSQMEKVLFNLLSNAFKYTPAKGRVMVRLQVKDQFVDVVVSDSGTGIPAEDQAKIFDDFYQVNSKRNQQIGWGIGLALVKNIIGLHKGQINLKSKVAENGKGGFTEFVISLRQGKDHFSEEELNTPEELSQQQYLFSDLDGLVIPSERQQQQSAKKYSVLVVEDNDELRHFIAQSLESSYTIVQCANGFEGLDRAKEEIPDVIVTDVTMPGLDGYQLCSKIKQDEVTSHIPVIMLTAMATHTNQVSGLEAGADMYITKPFSVQVLELSLRNILESREAVKLKYSRQVMLMPQKLHIESPEDRFLNKLMQIVEDNMEDPEFNVSTLVSEIGMSQTVLYKKIKALTGMSITDLLKSLRLKRAAQLLKENKLSISEVAYSVGFNDRKYFSKEFKKQFGIAPSEYIGSGEE